ncbi:MAG: phosphotransferase family protein [Pirellulales bacterium]
MQLIDAHSAEHYLCSTGRVAANERITVRELTGGVSNMVLLVERPDAPGRDFVLKQVRARLRTQQVWHSSIERIWREADVLALCSRLLARPEYSAADNALVARTPDLVFEDRAQYLLAITAAPRPNFVWKQALLEGRTDDRIAAACGRLLATLHEGTWYDPGVAQQLGDRALFDELRIDPYYRTLAAARPDARTAIGSLIESLAAHPRALVLADFSPKNLLLFEGGLMLVDFETGHYGDPAFDLGFFLTHLMLKACAKAPRHAAYIGLTEHFRAAYDRVLQPRVGTAELAQLWARGIQNFAGCAWARLDGKSPVDYLHDPARREITRELAREIFATRPGDWSQVAALWQQRLDAADFDEAIATLPERTT